MNDVGIKEFFLNSDHELSILHDEGVYRHLQMKQPNTNNMWYDIVTYPNNLVISGDMGCCVFSRINDMFQFFRTDELSINYSYWSEKEQATSIFGQNTEYDRSTLPKYLDMCRNRWVKKYVPSEDEIEEVDESLDDAKYIISYFRHEIEAYDFLGEIDEYSPLEKIIDQNYWELNFTKTTGFQEWRLYAINHAIRLYDAEKYKGNNNDVTR